MVIQSDFNGNQATECEALILYAQEKDIFLKTTSKLKVNIPSSYLLCVLSSIHCQKCTNVYPRVQIGDV